MDLEKLYWLDDVLVWGGVFIVLCGLYEVVFNEDWRKFKICLLVNILIYFDFYWIFLVYVSLYIYDCEWFMFYFMVLLIKYM